MPDPFSFTDPLAQPYLGGATSQPPASTPNRSVAGAMIAPRPADAVAFNPTTGAYLTPAKFNRDGSPAPKIMTGPDVAADNAQGSASIAKWEQAGVQPVDTMGAYLHGLRKRESGGNDMAVNGTTGATGRYQFLPSTWEGVMKTHPELGLTSQDIYNGEKQEQAIRAFTNDNVRILKSQGLPVDPGALYAMHFLGSGAGPQFLKAVQSNPDANAAAMFPAAARANPTVFYANGQPLSASQVHAQMSASFGGSKGASTDPLMTGTPMAFKETAQDAFTGAQLPQTLDNVKTGIEEVALKPRPGMTPIKETLKPLPGMTPINGGLKLDYNSKDPLKPTNPYAEDAKPKDDKITPEVIGVDPTTGMPIFADDKLNTEERNAENEVTKGIAAGVAQDVTGPASLLPNALGGGYAEQANEALGKTGDPFGRVIGNIAPMAIPAGEILGGIKAGGKALEAGESLLPTFGKSVAQGGATGALASSSNPSGKDTWGERLAAKAPGMAESGLIGGALAGAAPAVGAAAQWLGGEFGSLGKFVTDAIGKEAKQAAEDLRSGVSSETGKAMTAEEQKIAQAKVEEGAAKAKQAVADAELKHLDQQQERLRNRMQDRVKEKQSIAEKVGQDAEQAKAFAADQERAVAKAEESADQLAKDFAARPTMPAEEFGRKLQETALKDAKELAEKRRIESGFDVAVKSDGGLPSIPTKQFIAAAAEAEKRAVSGGAKEVLGKLKQDLQQQIEGGKVTAVSTERARRIVEDLDSKIDGLPPNEAHEITALKDKFVAHMEETRPALKTARKKYAELSRPLDVYRDTGALAKSTLEDPYSRRAIVDPTKVVGALLNKTEGGADALGHVIQKGGLQDSARKFFNQKLVDLAGKNPTPSEAQFANFLRDNRLALDRAGLTGEFKDLATAKATQERIAAQAKSGAAEATKAASEADKAVKAAESDVGKAKALKDRAAQPNLLKEQRAPAEEARKQSVQELATAAQKQKAAADIRDHLAKLDNKLDPKVARTGTEVTQEANKTADYLLDKGYLDPAAHKKLLADIREVEQKNLDHVKAAKLVKQILFAAVVGLVGVREVGSFVSHRITP